MKPEQQFNSCILDSDNLDDWLESDLRQSGILPSYNDNSASVKSSSDCESHSDESDDKTLVGDMKLDLSHKTDLHTNTPLPSPPPVVPILKVLAALTSLQQQGFAFPTPLCSSNHTTRPPTPPPIIPDAINPLHMHKTPAAPSPSIPSTLPAQKHIAMDSIKHKRPRESDHTATMDPVTLKRMKNTDAARRSRQRKLMKMEGLESRVHGLEKQNQQLLLQVAEAQRLRDAAKARESSQREKVVTLETELAQAQRSLVSRTSIKPEKD